MAFNIIKSDGSTLAIVTGNSVDTTSSSIALHGRGKMIWGNNVNENFVHMLENFASTTAPLNPLPGQVWYDNSTVGGSPTSFGVLKFYTSPIGSPGISQWIALSSLGSAGAAFVDVIGDTMTGPLVMDSTGITFDNSAGSPLSGNLILNSGLGNADNGPDIETTDSMLVASGNHMFLHLAKDGIGSPISNHFFRVGAGDDNVGGGSLVTNYIDLQTYRTFGVASGRQLDVASFLRVNPSLNGGNVEGRKFLPSEDYMDPSDGVNKSFSASFVNTGSDSGGIHIFTGDDNSDESAIYAVNYDNNRIFVVNATRGTIFAAHNTTGTITPFSDGASTSQFGGTILVSGATGDHVLRIGKYGTGNRSSYVDMSTTTTATDARLIKYSPTVADGEFRLQNFSGNSGTNAIRIYNSSGSGNILFHQTGAGIFHFAGGSWIDIDNKRIVDCARGTNTNDNARVDQTVGNFGYTWQQPGRSTGITYTNSTGRPIYISVRMLAGFGYGQGDLYIDSVNPPVRHVMRVAIDEESGNNLPLYGIVPPNFRYRILVAGTMSEQTWWELR